MKNINPEINEMTNAVVSDEELETVAGGVVQSISTGASNRVTCKNCGAVYMRGFHDECPMCRNKVSSTSVGINDDKNLINKNTSIQQNIVPLKK